MFDTINHFQNLNGLKKPKDNQTFPPMSLHFAKILRVYNKSKSGSKDLHENREIFFSETMSRVEAERILQEEERLRTLIIRFSSESKRRSKLKSIYCYYIVRGHLSFSY